MANPPNNLRHWRAASRKENRLTFEKLESRMMMAVDGIESALQMLASPAIFSTPPIVGNAVPTVARPVRLGGGTEVLGRTTTVSVLGADDKAESNLRYTWQTTSQPAGASVRFAASGTNAAKNNTLTFNRAGLYTIRVTIQDAAGASTTSSLRFNVKQTLTRAVAVSTTNMTLNTSNSLAVSGTNYRLVARGLDQFGQTMAVQPRFTWSRVTSPTGTLPAISASGNQATLTFRQSGLHSFKATSGSVTLNASFNVTPTLTRIQVTANSTSLTPGATRPYQAVGLDQFGKPLVNRPTFVWSATGGTIGTTGLFSAGTTAGTFSITARSGARSGATPVSIAAASTRPGINDPGISSLLTTYYADNQISRPEMIALLRSAGNDGVVSSTELADLHYLVSSSSTYAMPTHVRELAKDVVNSNPANATYQGQTAGNLVAGSPATLLNKLVDKWFLGADLPILTSSALSYRTAVGNLFSTAPALTDARQGALGDCYFIASLASIASENVNAIRNMFIDNGDNTFTIRFFGGALGYSSVNGLVTAGFVSGTGVADYITVNRSLPTYSNGTLAYSGNGLSASSTTAPLWIALAEKAYAQWNQTRNAGRDGTNRYASIEGGWMSNTNAQILGYNSTNHSMASTSKQTLVNAVNANQSVTIGTTTSTAALVKGHAYIVTGYNPSTDKFTLHNPWGVSHPSPMTWAQLQANTTMFVVTNPSGTNVASSGTVRSAATELLIGNGTEVVYDADSATTSPFQETSADTLSSEVDTEDAPMFVHDTMDPISNFIDMPEFEPFSSESLDGEQALSSFAWQINADEFLGQIDTFMA